MRWAEFAETLAELCPGALGRFGPVWSVKSFRIGGELYKYEGVHNIGRLASASQRSSLAISTHVFPTVAAFLYAKL